MLYKTLHLHFNFKELTPTFLESSDFDEIGMRPTVKNNQSVIALWSCTCICTKYVYLWVKLETSPFFEVG